MKKILPNLYKGKVNKVSKNQKETFINKEEKKKKVNVDKQVNDIFSSPNYVYKADVSIITTTGETIKKTIIGRTNNSLITIDDELIDVSKISQIDFLN